MSNCQNIVIVDLDILLVDLCYLYTYHSAPLWTYASQWVTYIFFSMQCEPMLFKKRSLCMHCVVPEYIITSPQRRTLLPLWKIQFSFTHFLKFIFWSVRTPLPSRNFQSFLCYSMNHLHSEYNYTMYYSYEPSHCRHSGPNASRQGPMPLNKEN